MPTSVPLYDVPPFRPARLLWGGHLQTLSGFFWPPRPCPPGTMRHEVGLDDGDRLVLHDDRPSSWREGDRAVLLIHGLAGSHASGYMLRVSARLQARGARTFRLDLRGCGAGAALARLPYHSGRSLDALAALRAIAALCPGSRLSAVGFSLGGNILLKLLGESPDLPPGCLDRAAAVGPPIDLAACVAGLARGFNRMYDRYFVRLLMQQLRERRQLRPDLAWVDFAPRGMAEFDAAYTAPVCGFGTAENYWRQCSAEQFLGQIRVPTWIVAAADDPLVPVEPFRRVAWHAELALHISPHGGHLGFVGRGELPGQRNWLDGCLCEWLIPHAP